MLEYLTMLSLDIKLDGEREHKCGNRKKPKGIYGYEYIIEGKKKYKD